MTEELNVRNMTPGLLVTELVSIQGGVHYDREYEESYFEDKSQIRAWRTISKVDDVDERVEAQKLRSRIYQKVRACCIKTPVGLICDDGRGEDLKKALREIKEDRDSFNKSSKTCRVSTHHACFKVESDNHETISAILEQVAGVAENVNSAITQDDESTLKASAKRWLKGMKPEAILLLPKAERDAVVARARAELIRKAIKDIKGVERLLPNAAGLKAKQLARESRKIATRLCLTVEKHNNKLDDVLNEVNLAGIKKTRAAFVLAAAKADERALAPEEKIPLVAPRKLAISAD